MLLVLSMGMSCITHSKKDMEVKQVNPLLCDTTTGICEIPGMQNTGSLESPVPVNKPIKIIYFTDPICSSCWGIEPQLRRLKLEYGHVIEFDYHMGGLLPDWSYNSGGISQPSDVAHHWDEVSQHYQMPIDGDVWLEDPLNSSYPPSIAFKAAQLQDKGKALVFLRRIREMVFLEKKNITRWEHLALAATQSGLDAGRLKTDTEQQGKTDFNADLELARKMGVRGFPSVFITDSSGRSEFVYGFRPYTSYEEGIKKLLPAAIKNVYDKSWESLFKHYPTLTTREFGELSDLNVKESELLLEKLMKEGKLTQLVTKNGVLWKLKV